MSEMKFGADYLAEGGRVGGHIIISDDKFIWKPVKFSYIGHVDPVEIPITDVKTYIKKGSTLYLSLAGIQGFVGFYTWKGDKIIDAIKEKNPQFRMMSSDEYSFEKTSFWQSEKFSWIIAAIIAAVLYFIFH